MRRQVAILAAAQGISQTVSVLVMTVGALAGAALAPAGGMATLPITAMFLGTALLTFPASMWMSRVGRKRGFIAGAFLGVAGGAVASLGVSVGSFWWFCVGTFLVGAYQAFAQFHRFAASEVADDDYRPRAISYVMAGGIVAAFAGPYLGKVGGPLLEPDYLGSFLLLALVSIAGAGVLAAVRLPHSREAEQQTGGRRWREIVSQPSYAVALFAAATGAGVMILAMTATPLAMVGNRHSLGDAAMVIQLHVLGMFLPSFFTGSLIARLGAIPIMLCGVLILAGHVLMTLTGTGVPSFAGALILLGLGWNFLFIGGTTLLTTTYTEAERGRAQATNDMAIYLVGLSCSFAAGVMLDAFGWQGLNLALLPWLAICALALLWHGVRERQSKRAVASEVSP